MTCWFTGSNSYGTVAESKSLEMTGALTIAFWVRPSQNSQATPTVISKLGDWNVQFNGSNRYPQLNVGSQYAELNYALPLITWHHVVFTFSNGVVKGYVDGAPVSTIANTIAAASLPSAASGLFIAALNGSYANPFIGSLDDVRIYNRALAAADVTALYKALPQLN